MALDLKLEEKKWSYALGIGLVIGATGNLVIARAVIRAAERAFGPPPAQWPGSAPAVQAAAPVPQPAVEA